MALLKPYTPPRRYIPKIIKHEENLQKRVCTYLRQNYPGVDFHSDYTAGIQLSKSQAGIRKAMNSGRGWADLFIPEAHRGYHGLFLELKKDGVAIYVTRGPRKGKLVASEQIQIEAAFLARMNAKGYLARFAVGYDKTIALIDWYMEKPENGSLF
jgi:hypothetical protein